MEGVANAIFGHQSISTADLRKQRDALRDEHMITIASTIAVVACVAILYGTPIVTLFIAKKPSMLLPAVSIASLVGLTPFAIPRYMEHSLRKKNQAYQKVTQLLEESNVLEKNLNSHTLFEMKEIKKSFD